MQPSAKWLGLALLILISSSTGLALAQTCRANTTSECKGKAPGDACTKGPRSGFCDFEDSSAEKTKSCSCITSEPLWHVSIELGAQGSTFNSSKLAVDAENPSLFEDTNPFVGLVGSVPLKANDEALLRWAIRFASVDAEFAPDPADADQATKLLNDAESVYISLELQHSLGSSSSFYASVRASGYSPTEDSSDPETRADFLGEYAIFVGVANREEEARLRNSTVQLGWGLSDRFLEDKRFFVEVHVDFDVTQGTSFVVDLGTAIGSGADDLRAAFGFRTTLSGFFD